MAAADPTSIREAAAAAAAAHRAAVEAERQAAEEARSAEARGRALDMAKERLTGFLDVWLDPAVLTYEFREGSVIATDGESSLAIRPDRTVWVASLGDDGEWTAHREVQSLLDVAAVLEVG